MGGCRQAELGLLRGGRAAVPERWRRPLDRSGPWALLANSARPEAFASNMRAALLNEGFRRGLHVTGDSVDATMGLFVQTAEQVNA